MRNSLSSNLCTCTIKAWKGFNKNGESSLTPSSRQISVSLCLIGLDFNYRLFIPSENRSLKLVGRRARKSLQASIVLEEPGSLRADASALRQLRERSYRVLNRLSQSSSRSRDRSQLPGLISNSCQSPCKGELLYKTEISHAS